VAIHELCHGFDLPDYYDMDGGVNDSDGDKAVYIAGLAHFDIMASPVSQL